MVAVRRFRSAIYRALPFPPRWRENSIRSPLREMFRVYRSYRKRHPEPEIDDEWVMQVIQEAQEEERRNPMTTEELVAEFEELARYGAEQAKKVGIDVEDDEVINRLVHEERARWREKQKNRT
jgi:adenylate kinase family enzyme